MNNNGIRHTPLEHASAVSPSRAQKGLEDARGYSTPQLDHRCRDPPFSFVPTESFLHRRPGCADVPAEGHHVLKRAGDTHA